MDNNYINHSDLLRSINHWNQYRVPVLQISTPDKNLNFHGAMRFYFQDAGQKVATKCVNVTSQTTTKEIIHVLIEKFRPDMRMLSVPEYGLYEIHENGDERKLGPDERPLFVQLEWNKDDREGRFLLRRMDEKTQNLAAQNNDLSLKRIAEKLYNELPETSFTRSISNPEAVMKRRRAQKLQKPLQEFSLEGGQEAGGTLRIFGETINKDVSYKTLLLSTKDTASNVVKQILEKYGKENEDPSNYCLVKLIVPSSATSGDTNSVHDLGIKESILDDDDSPLLINQMHDKSRGILTFHIRPRPPGYKKLRNDKILPALIQVREDVEDIFLSRVITHIKPTEVPFRLAPTYVLYMVSRYRASTLFHPELQAPRRAELFMPFTRKIAYMIRRTIEAHARDPVYLAFWLANSSDLNHFYKQDKHLSHFTMDAQEILYESIHASFKYLLSCKQLELDAVLPSFFDERDDSMMDRNPIIEVLNDLMSTMRKNRVNPALTIQIFSHLFHHIGKWLFDILIRVYDKPGIIGGQPKLYYRLSLINSWAEKQGLEQAAEFHLARVTLLMNGGPASVDYPLGEDFYLNIPRDGYSSELIRYIPNNLMDFVSHLSRIRINNQELCIFTIQPTSSGQWTVYFKNNQPDAPEIIMLQLRKMNNSMGLSIIAARGEGQERLGIYIKNVVKNGAAAMDGRLQAGDLLLEVDGNSLLDITQEQAAKLLMRTGPVVTLKIAKQAAIYHKVSDIINMVPTQTIVSQAQPHHPPMHFQPPPPPPMMQPAPAFVQSAPTLPTLPAPPAPIDSVYHQPPPPPLPQANNMQSPIKSPKKVSWVDTHPHQSLHTLIPLPQEPEPEHNLMPLSQESEQEMDEEMDQVPEPELEPGSEPEQTMIRSQLEPDSENTLIPVSQEADPENSQGLTLEDIDEVLSSEQTNNWLEDSAGVIGTQEVYNDPRQRIVKERQRPPNTDINIEKLSFQEKLKMFNTSGKK